MPTLLLTLWLLVSASAPTSQSTTQPHNYDSNVPKLIADLRRQIENLKADVDLLTKKNVDLTRELERISRGTLKPDDPISAAISKHQLTVGMTLVQANAALDEDWDGPKITRQFEDSISYQWRCIRSHRDVSDHAVYVGSTWEVTVRDGKIFAVQSP